MISVTMMMSRSMMVVAVVVMVVMVVLTMTVSRVSSSLLWLLLLHNLVRFFNPVRIVGLSQGGERGKHQYKNNNLCRERRNISQHESLMMMKTTFRSKNKNSHFELTKILN